MNTLKNAGWLRTGMASLCFFLFVPSAQAQLGSLQVTAVAPYHENQSTGSDAQTLFSWDPHLGTPGNLDNFGINVAGYYETDVSSPPGGFVNAVLSSGDYTAQPYISLGGTVFGVAVNDVCALTLGVGTFGHTSQSVASPAGAGINDVAASATLSCLTKTLFDVSSSSPSGSNSQNVDLSDTDVPLVHIDVPIVSGTLDATITAGYSMDYTVNFGINVATASGDFASGADVLQSAPMAALKSEMAAGTAISGASAWNTSLTELNAENETAYSLSRAPTFGVHNQHKVTVSIVPDFELSAYGSATVGLEVGLASATVGVSVEATILEASGAITLAFSTAARYADILVNLVLDALKVTVNLTAGWEVLGGTVGHSYSSPLASWPALVSINWNVLVGRLDLWSTSLRWIPCFNFASSTVNPYHDQRCTVDYTLDPNIPLVVADSATSSYGTTANGSGSISSPLFAKIRVPDWVYYGDGMTGGTTTSVAYPRMSFVPGPLETGSGLYGGFPTTVTAGTGLFGSFGLYRARPLPTYSFIPMQGHTAVVFNGTSQISASFTPCLENDSTVVSLKPCNPSSSGLPANQLWDIVPILSSSTAETFQVKSSADDTCLESNQISVPAGTSSTLMQTLSTGTCQTAAAAAANSSIYAQQEFSYTVTGASPTPPPSHPMSVIGTTPVHAVTASTSGPPVVQTLAGGKMKIMSIGTGPVTEMCFAMSTSASAVAAATIGLHGAGCSGSYDSLSSILVGTEFHLTLPAPPSCGSTTVYYKGMAAAQLSTGLTPGYGGVMSTTVRSSVPCAGGLPSFKVTSAGAIVPVAATASH